MPRECRSAREAALRCQPGPISPRRATARARTGFPRSPCRSPTSRLDGSRCRRAPRPAPVPRRRRGRRSTATRRNRRVASTSMDANRGRARVRLPAFSLSCPAILQFNVQEVHPELTRARWIVCGKLNERQRRLRTRRAGSRPRSSATRRRCRSCGDDLPAVDDQRELGLGHVQPESARTPICPPGSRTRPGAALKNSSGRSAS
jgi:hypothetical protein